MYAVLGNPINHSLSPRIFELFAAQVNEAIDYQAIQVKPEELSTTLERLYHQGYRGLNLTSPLKETVLPLLKSRSEAARAAFAVNVLTIQSDGSYHGHNSDGAGFIRDLKNKHCVLQDQTILILGAGGAVRGLMANLLRENPGVIFIYNRTEAKAQQIIRDFQCGGSTSLAFVSWENLTKFRFDLIIHCTTLGLQGERLPLPKEILKPETCCYDLSYGKGALPFLNGCREQGASICYDGLGMLVEQAAEAFFLWRGHRVKTAPVLKVLSEFLSSVT